MLKVFRSRLLVFGVMGLSVFLAASSCKKNETPPAAVSSAGIRIGLNPNETKEGIEALARELSSRSGEQISFVVAPSYTQLVQDFKDGKVDFAFFSPSNFLQAEREAQAKVLLKKVYGESEFYYSAILVRSDSKIKDLKALKGKSFLFVDEKSTSGHLYPLMMLKNSGIGLADIQSSFSGTHSNSIRSLADGKVDAVGVWADDPKKKTGAWTGEEFKTISARFKVLSYSNPIPNDAFVVRESFYKEKPLAVFRIMEALIGMADDPERRLKKTFGIDRMATATSRHYDTVRALEKALEELKTP